MNLDKIIQEGYLYDMVHNKAIVFNANIGNIWL